MAAPSASVAVPDNESARWPPGWLTDVGVVIASWVVLLAIENVAAAKLTLTAAELRTLEGLAR